MNRRSFFSLVAAAAICGGSVFFVAPAKADCGFLNCVGKAIGLGGITQPLDDLNREIINRSGPNSTYSQIMGSYNNPVGNPAGPVPGTPAPGYGGGYPPPPQFNNGYPPPPPQVAYSNRCVFFNGGFKYGQMAPVGAPCLTMTPNGPIYGQVL